MIICRGDTSYKCGEFKQTVKPHMRIITIQITDCISPEDARSIFEDDTFYFYDDWLSGKLPDTNDTKLVGLGITYNADSTCNITIKLTRRSC